MPKATYVALLRAVNVGGNNKLPMAELREIFAACGGENVRSYIQSGNVIFHGLPKMCGVLPDKIHGRYGFRPPLVLRSIEQIEAAIPNNPFLKTGASIDRLPVMFLASQPSPAAVASLDPHR